MNDKNETGYVYILTNPAMPEYIKVGRTNNIERRLKDLSGSTSVPEPFSCYAYIKIPAGCGATAGTVEDGLHRILKKHITHHKEFFKTTPLAALDYFESICKANSALEIVTNAKPQQVVPAKRSPARNTTFAMLGVPVGAVLAFRKDPSVTCTVSNSINQVNWNGQKYSISALAGELYNGRSVNGFECFTWPAGDHPEETLVERRCRLGL